MGSEGPKGAAQALGSGTPPPMQRVPKLLGTYFEKWKGEYRATPGKFPPAVFIIVTAMGGFVALLVMCFSVVYGSVESHNYLAILGSHGATMVLVFAAPAGPFSQPRNIVLGNFIASLVGVGCRVWIAHPMGNVGLAMALSVTISYVLMHLTRSLNPPAGGTAAIAVLSSPELERLGWKLVIPAVLYGCVFIVVACLFINLIPGYRYPRYWFVEQAFINKHVCKKLRRKQKKGGDASFLPAETQPESPAPSNPPPPPVKQEEELSATGIAAVSQNPSLPFREQYHFPGEDEDGNDIVPEGQDEEAVPAASAGVTGYGKDHSSSTTNGSSQGHSPLHNGHPLAKDSDHVTLNLV